MFLQPLQKLRGVSGIFLTATTFPETQKFFCSLCKKITEAVLSFYEPKKHKEN